MLPNDFVESSAHIAVFIGCRCEALASSDCPAAGHTCWTDSAALTVNTFTKPLALVPGTKGRRIPQCRRSIDRGVAAHNVSEARQKRRKPTPAMAAAPSFIVSFSNTWTGKSVLGEGLFDLATGPGFRKRDGRFVTQGTLGQEKTSVLTWPSNRRFRQCRRLATTRKRLEINHLFSM